MVRTELGLEKIQEVEDPIAWRVSAWERAREEGGHSLRPEK